MPFNNAGVAVNPLTGLSYYFINGANLSLVYRTIAPAVTNKYVRLHRIICAEYGGTGGFVIRFGTGESIISQDSQYVAPFTLDFIDQPLVSLIANDVVEWIFGLSPNNIFLQVWYDYLDV